MKNFIIKILGILYFGFVITGIINLYLRHFNWHGFIMQICVIGFIICAFVLSTQGENNE